MSGFTILIGIAVSAGMAIVAIIWLARQFAKKEVELQNKDAQLDAVKRYKKRENKLSKLTKSELRDYLNELRSKRK